MTGSVTRRPASLKHSSQNERPPGSDLRRSATETGPGSLTSGCVGLTG